SAVVARGRRRPGWIRTATAVVTAARPNSAAPAQKGDANPTRSNSTPAPTGPMIVASAALACVPPLASPCSFGATSLVIRLDSEGRHSALPSDWSGADNTYRNTGSGARAMTTNPNMLIQLPSTRIVVSGRTLLR